MAKAKLDQIDLDLLGLLRADAWLSIKELAGKVGLSASSVHDRVKRLRAQRVLRGAHADVDMELLGYGLDVLVMIELTRHDTALVSGLIDELSSVAEVQAVFFLSGDTDLVVRIAARDTKSLRPHLEKLASREEVGRLRTALVYEARFPGKVTSSAEDE